ncbi:hypothetical protein V8C86DRAFT_3139065 [Haematococcus lacustris]
MRPLRSAANPPFAWLWEDKNLADATLLLHVTGKPTGSASLSALRVHRAVLGAHSEHFRTTVLQWADGESQRAADFQPTIAVAHFIKVGSLPAGLTAQQLAQETFDSLEMCDAARLVVRCMYEGGLAEEVKDPLTLARLVLVLRTLPGNCTTQPEHSGWQEHVRGLIVSQYGDVHAVITSAQLRGYFQQLPFAAVQQWAGSDELTVDSENSVVELISLWMAGPGGQACSKEQKQLLSCLVRVQHLSPAYALGRLPALDWFDIPGASTAIVAQAASCGFGMRGAADASKAPPAWSAAHRKQLDPDDLLRRTIICWEVPRLQLADMLASKDQTAKISSKPVYAAGVGWRLCVDLQKRAQDAPNSGQELAPGRDEPDLSFSNYGQLVTYAECDGHSLGAPLEHGAPINYFMSWGTPVRVSEAWTFAWVVDEWGRSTSGDKTLKRAADSRTRMRLQITSAFQVLHKAQQTLVPRETLKQP